MSDLQETSEQMADALKALVTKRTGLSGSHLVCPYEKSDMTPCLARDGHLALVLVSLAPGPAHERPVCVGCERLLELMFMKEQAKHV